MNGSTGEPGAIQTTGRWVSCRRNARSGFTLSEIMIGAAVLALVLSAVLLALMMNRRSSEMALRHTQAMHRARAQLETITESDWDAALLQPGTRSYPGGTYTITDRGDGLTRDIVMRATWATPMINRTNTLVLTTSVSETLHK